MRNRNAIHPLLAVVVLVLAACQPAEEEPQSVEERAQARWDHVLAKEYEQAWNYFSPGFRDLHPFQWTSAEVIGSKCKENQCDVTVSATYRIARGPSELGEMVMPKELTEKWVRTDGQWWYVKN